MYRAFFIILAFLSIIPLEAQPGTCECFETEIIRARDTLVNCRYYEFQVRNDGNCKHGLSNFTMEIECGTVSNVWNSLQSPIELNFKDPNNGLWGFKVDDIQDFGESQLPDSFQVGFIFCPKDDYCADLQSYWEPVVAYKAGRCIIYDTLDISFLPGFTPRVQLAPNPSSGPISFTIPGKGNARLEILDLFGNQMMLLLDGDFSRQQRLHRTFDTQQLIPGLYIYHLRTNYGTSSGRILVQ